MRQELFKKYLQGPDLPRKKGQAFWTVQKYSQKKFSDSAI